jgi:hypothetical protein
MLERVKPVDGIQEKLKETSRIQEKIVVSKRTGISLFDQAGLSDHDLQFLDQAVNRKKELNSFDVIQNVLSLATPDDMNKLSGTLQDIRRSIDDVAKKTKIGELLDCIDSIDSR